MRPALRGGVRAEACGAEPGRFLNALAASGTPYRAASAVAGVTLRLELDAADMAAARAAAARSQCTLRVLRERGAGAAARRLRRRIALLAAGAACFALLAASSLFVWRVDISGCETVPEGELRRALAECGVRPGAFWPAWSAGEIANAVILRIPELSWVGVSVDGSRASVDVRERLPAPEIGTAPGSVTARATGVIESVEVFAGEPKVAPGDAVTEGETLVSGEVADAQGGVRYVRASARVTARTWRELSAAAPLEYVSLAEEGARTRWSLAVGDRLIKFFAGSSQTPEGCGKIVSQFPLEWEGVFSLPLTLVRETVVSYSAAPAGEDAAALEARLKSELEAELERRLDGRGEAVSQHFTARVSGSTLVVTLRAECREDIAAAPEGGTD